MEQQAKISRLQGSLQKPVLSKSLCQSCTLQAVQSPNSQPRYPCSYPATPSETSLCTMTASHQVLPLHKARMHFVPPGIFAKHGTADAHFCSTFSKHGAHRQPWSPTPSSTLFLCVHAEADASANDPAKNKTKKVCGRAETDAFANDPAKNMKYVFPNLGGLLGVPPAQPGAIFDQLTAPRMQHMLRVQRHAVHQHGDDFQEGLEAMSHELFEVRYLIMVNHDTCHSAVLLSCKPLKPRHKL